jgi:DNA-directed RNA polymerase subunit N (RpoN/RPB10)
MDLEDRYDEDAKRYPERSERTAAKISRYLELIEEKKGNVSAIARELTITRSVCFNYIQSHVELADALKDWRETVVDKAEENIFDAAMTGDQGASRLIVQTLGKDRGWVPREEKTGADGEPLVPPSITFAPYADPTQPATSESTNAVGFMPAQESANGSDGS